MFPGTPGECAASATFRVDYKYYDSGKAIHPALHVVNTADAAVPLSQIEVYYFFSQEETTWKAAQVYEAAANGAPMPASNVVVSVGALSPVLTNATHYLRIAFTGTVSLQTDAFALLNIDLQPVDYSTPDQDQSNDYSFDSGHSGFAEWDKITVFDGGTLAWGCVPDTI